MMVNYLTFEERNRLGIGDEGPAKALSRLRYHADAADHVIARQQAKIERLNEEIVALNTQLQKLRSELEAVQRVQGEWNNVPQGQLNVD